MEFAMVTKQDETDPPFGDGPVVDIIAPRSLESLTRVELIAFARSVIGLNRRLVRGWNATLKSCQEMDAAITEMLEEGARLEAADAAEEVAAEQGSETSAAADWPGSVRNT
jgi:hypothetical protein